MCLSRTYQMAAEEADCPNSAMEELLRPHRWRRKSVLAYNASDLRLRVNRVAQSDRGPNNRLHLIMPAARDRRIDTSSPVRAASQALDQENIITWVVREANFTEARDEGDTKALVHHYFDPDVSRAMQRQPHTLGVVAPPLAAFVHFAAKYNEQVWLCIRGGSQPLILRTGYEARLTERGDHGSLSMDFGPLDDTVEWSDATRASNYIGCLVLAPKNFLPNLNEDVTSILLAPELQVDSDTEDLLDQPIVSASSHRVPSPQASQAQPVLTKTDSASKTDKRAMSQSPRLLPPTAVPAPASPGAETSRAGGLSQEERESLLESQRLMQAPDFLTQGMDELCETLPLPVPPPTDYVTPVIASAEDKGSSADLDDIGDDDEDVLSDIMPGRESIASVADAGFSVAISQDEVLHAQLADDRLLAEMDERLRQSIVFGAPVDSQDWI